MDFTSFKEFSSKEWDNVPAVVKHMFVKQKQHNDIINKQIGEKTISLKIEKNLTYIKQSQLVFQNFKQDYLKDLNKTNSQIGQIHEVFQQQKIEIQNNFEKLKIMDVKSTQEENFQLELFQQLISSQDTQKFEFQNTFNIWKLINQFYYAQNLDSRIQKIEQHLQYQDQRFNNQDEKFDKNSINLQKINDSISQLFQDQQQIFLQQDQIKFNSQQDSIKFNSQQKQDQRKYNIQISHASHPSQLVRDDSKIFEQLELNRINLQNSIQKIQSDLQNIQKKSDQSLQDSQMQKILDEKLKQFNDSLTKKLDKINLQYDGLKITNDLLLTKNNDDEIKQSQIQAQNIQDQFKIIELQFQLNLEEQKAKNDVQLRFQQDNLKYTLDQIKEQHMKTTHISDIKEFIETQIKTIKDQTQKDIFQNQVLREAQKADMLQLGNLQSDMFSRQIAFQKNINQIKDELQIVISMDHKEFNNQIHKRIKCHEAFIYEKINTIEKSVKVIVASLQNFAKQRAYISRQLIQNNTESDSNLLLQSTDDVIKNQSYTIDTYQSVSNQTKQTTQQYHKNMLMGSRAIKLKKRIIPDKSQTISLAQQNTLEYQNQKIFLSLKKRIFSSNNQTPAKTQFNSSHDSGSRFHNSRNPSASGKKNCMAMNYIQKLENNASNQLSVNMEQVKDRLVDLEDEQQFQDLIFQKL